MLRNYARKNMVTVLEKQVHYTRRNMIRFYFTPEVQCQCEFCCHFSFIFLFFYLVIFYFFSNFPHAVFIVRKFMVISIVPIQYCLAHLNKLISVI